MPSHFGLFCHLICLNLHLMCLIKCTISQQRQISFFLIFLMNRPYLYRLWQSQLQMSTGTVDGMVPHLVRSTVDTLNLNPIMMYRTARTSVKALVQAVLYVIIANSDIALNQNPTFDLPNEWTRACRACNSPSRKFQFLWCMHSPTQNRWWLSDSTI